MILLKVHQLIMMHTTWKDWLSRPFQILGCFYYNTKGEYPLKTKKNKLFSLSHSLATIRIVAFRIVKISAKREKINYLDFSSWTTNSGSTKLSLMTLKIFKALLMIKLNYRKINPWYKNRQNPRFAIDKSNEGKINESTFIV